MKAVMATYRKILTAGVSLGILITTGCNLPSTSDASSGTAAGTGTGAIAPTALVVSAVTNNSITVGWTNNATDAEFITVESCMGSGCTNFTEVSRSPYGPTAASHTESGLTSATTYRFRVKATSQGGPSSYLTSSDITTLMIPNTTLTTSAASNSITLGWTDNDPSATGVEVQECVGSGCTNFVDTLNSPLASTAVSDTESGLQEGTTYRFQVREIKGSSFSSWLTSSNITTLAAAPTNFMQTAVTGTTISLGWTNNSAIDTGYQVQMCAGSGCSNFADIPASPLAANSTSTTITGLTPGTTYQFQIRTLAAVGNSAFVASGGIDTTAAAPTGLAAGTVTDTSIQLSWTNNSLDAIYFELQRCSGVGCVVFSDVSGSPLSPTTVSYTDTGLAASTDYSYQIRAVNSVGPSSWDTLSAVETAPAAPTGFTLGAVADVSVGFSWTDNATDGTGYEVQSCAGSNCSNFADVAGSPIAAHSASETVNALTEEITYNFRLRSIRGATASAWLTSGNVSTIPAAPTGLAAPNATITDTGLQLTWTNNASGGLLIEIQRCTGSACSSFADLPASPLGPSITTFTDSALTGSTDYSYQIRTTGLTGSSAWTSLANVETASPAPSNFTTGAVSYNSIGFSWTRNASDETGYEVQSCTGSNCSSFSDVAGSPFAGTTTSTTVSSLTGSTTYKFRVRAQRGAVNSNWLTSGNITTTAAPVTAAACTSPNTVIIDKGQKTNAAGVGRGLWSDTAIIPTTQYPATAYYDGSATGGDASIKISWWNGTNFSVEDVAGDAFVAAGSATWVRLGFLQTGANAGRPIIVWTTGGSAVKAAIRSAALSTAGTWSVGIIDNVATASRNAALSIGPGDIVGIAYATNSTAAGRVRFIYCNGPCSSLAGFTTMTAGTDTVENTTQAANLVEIGVGWCQHAANTYYPAVVYHGNTAADVRYAVCTNSNYTNCQTSAGWTAQNVVGIVAPVGVSMLIDPTVLQDTVKIIYKSAAGNALTSYTSTGGCDGPTAWTLGAKNISSSVNSGTAWFKLIKDAGGLFHVIANDALTSVVYYNSNSSNYQATTWNAVGTIENVTLPAVNAGAGGADIATSAGMIFSSYGLGAAPFDLDMGIVNDITIPSNNAAAIYTVDLPDLTGNIVMPLIAGKQERNVAVAATSTGLPGVAYVDHSIGTLAGGRLKYAFRNGTTHTTNWSIQTLPNAVNPLFPSLAYDNNNLPWISFYDSSDFRYFLATNTSSDGSGTWIFYQIPIGAKIASAVAPATDDTALAMYYSGGVAQPVVIYINGTAAGGTGVRSVKLNPSTGTWSSVTTVDALGGSFATRLSADFDTNGNIIIAYYDLTTTTLKFNFSQTGGLIWRPASAQITAATVGQEGVSVKFNPATDVPAVAYYNRANNFVYYSACSTSLSSCGSSGNWTQTLAQSATAVGVSGITATTNEQVLNTALTFSGSGVPFISYMTGIAPSGMNPGLVVTDSGTGFTPTLPVALATNTTSALTGAAAMNFGQYGLNVGSVRNSLGQLINVHVGPNNWLYSTSCGD